MPWSLDSYEEFVYRIRDYSPRISFSTLVLQRRGKLAGVLKGEIAFAKDITLAVFENLNFLTPDGNFIVDYGYEVKSGDATQYWYDSQPHLNDPTLQAFGAENKQRIRITNTFHRTSI
jgi:hypothetical protein